jgi:4-amino-4-deoxy-L-arabinose transferase-like glycosyltransferase
METERIEQAIISAMPTVRDLAEHALRHTQISSWLWTACGAVVVVAGICCLLWALRHKFDDENTQPFVVIMLCVPIAAGFIAFAQNLPDALEPLGATVKSVTRGSK